MTWNGDERRRNQTVNVEELAGEIMKQVIEVLKPIRLDMKKQSDDLNTIKQSLRNDDGTGLSQRLASLWGTVYGNGKPGLCEHQRFMNFKMTLFGSIGTASIFLVKWIVEQIRG